MSIFSFWLHKCEMIGASCSGRGTDQSEQRMFLSVKGIGQTAGSTQHSASLFPLKQSISAFKNGINPGNRLVTKTFIFPLVGFELFVHKYFPFTGNCQTIMKCTYADVICLII